MKEVVLAALLLLGGSVAFGVSVEKRGILVEYRQCPKYKNNVFGSAYCIQLTNNTNHPIMVDKALISVPVVSYQDIAKALRVDRLLFGGLFTINAALLGSLSWYLSKNSGQSGIAVERYPSGRIKRMETKTPLWQVKLGAGIAGLMGLIGTYELYKLATETQKILEAKLAKEVLHAPITIQPGQSVEKLFWLKNPKDQFVIEFDAVKVLK